jgi:hypothetical protein
MELELASQGGDAGDMVFALHVLSNLGVDAVLPLVTPHMDSIRPEVRSAAVFAACSVPGPRAWDCLRTRALRPSFTEATDPYGECVWWQWL